MELNDAVRRMGRGYPGGLEALAVRLRKSYSTLDKEIRGSQGFKLGLQDAHDIAVMCHDSGSAGAMDLLNLMAVGVGHVLLPMPAAEGAGAMTLQRLGVLMKECADVVATVTKAMEDGKVCDNELKLCTLQWSEMVAAGQLVMQDLQEMNAASMAQWREREGK